MLNFKFLLLCSVQSIKREYPVNRSITAVTFDAARAKPHLDVNMRRRVWKKNISMLTPCPGEMIGAVAINSCNTGAGSQLRFERLS